MSKSYEAQGTVHSIGQTTEYGNNGFTKREFVIQLTGPDENSQYPNYIALELIKDKCQLMDKYNIGDEIQVTFNLSGRLWSSGDKPEKCFTSLQAWKISSLSENDDEHHQQAPPESWGDSGAPPFDDEIPF